MRKINVSDFEDRMRIDLNSFRKDHDYGSGDGSHLKSEKEWLSLFVTWSGLGEKNGQ